MDRFGLAYGRGDDTLIRIPYKNTTIRQSLLTCPDQDEQKKTIISKLRDFFFEFDDGRMQCVVNHMFISYPMKDGMCRLINQNGIDKYKITNSSGTRFLDLSLSFADDNLLATLDKAGIMSLWRVMPKDYVYLMDLHFPPRETVRRVILNRSPKAEYFITTHHDFLRIWDLNSIYRILESPQKYNVPKITPTGKKQPKLAVECDESFLQQVSAKFPFPNLGSVCWGIDGNSVFVASQDRVILLRVSAGGSNNAELVAPRLTEALSFQVDPYSEITSMNILSANGEGLVLVVGSEDDTTFRFYLYQNGPQLLQTIRFRTDSGGRMRRGLVSVNREREEERDVLVILQEQIFDPPPPTTTPTTPTGENMLGPVPQQTLLCMRLSAYEETNWIPIQSMLKISCPESSSTLQTVTGMPNAMVEERQSIFFFLTHNRFTDTRGSVIYCQSVNHAQILPEKYEGCPLPVTDDVCDFTTDERSVQGQLQSKGATDARQENGGHVFANGVHPSQGEKDISEAFSKLTTRLDKTLLHQLGDVVSNELDKSTVEANDKINQIMQHAFDDTDQMLARELKQAMAKVEEGASACNKKVQDLQWSLATYERQVMASVPKSLRDATTSALNDLTPQLRRELEKVSNVLIDAIAKEIVSNKDFGYSLGQAQSAALSKQALDAWRPSEQMIEDTVQSMLPELIDHTVTQHLLVDLRTLFENSVFPVLEIALQDLVKRHNKESIEIVNTEVILPLTDEVTSLQKSVQILQQRVEGVNFPKVDSLHQAIQLFNEGKVSDAFLMAIKAQANGEEDLLTGLCSKVPSEDVETWLSSESLSSELKLFLALALAQQLHSDSHRLSDECIFAKILWIREIAITLVVGGRENCKPNAAVVQPMLNALALFRTGPRGALMTEQEYKFILRIMRALHVPCE